MSEMLHIPRPDDLPNTPPSRRRSSNVFSMEGGHHSAPEPPTTPAPARTLPAVSAPGTTPAPPSVASPSRGASCRRAVGTAPCRNPYRDPVRIGGGDTSHPPRTHKD
ncbi:hypothetical protein BN2537_3731 [Streptomyces venezuelae]|nr:hypothetical protein BN2537_3731 [Streptomyces venezuelae]